MIHAKNNESLSKFVNVIHKILPAPLDTCFSTTGTFFGHGVDVKNDKEVINHDVGPKFTPNLVGSDG